MNKNAVICDKHYRYIWYCKKKFIETVPNLSGRTLKLQQDQRTGTLQDVEVEQQGLFPDYSDRLR